LIEESEYWRILGYLVNKEFTSLWEEIVENIKKEELEKVKNSVNKEEIEKKIRETEKFSDISLLWRRVNYEVTRITNELQEKRLKELEQELKPFNEYLAKIKIFLLKSLLMH
jgi:hypothetical protein